MPVVEIVQYDFTGNDAPLNAAFKRAESQSHQHVTTVNNELKNIGTSIQVDKHFETAAKKVEAEAKAHTSRMNSILGEVGSGLKEKLGGIMSGVASVFGGGFLLNAVSGGERAIESLVERGVEFEETWQKATLRMTAFTGNAKEATATLKQLHQIAVDRALEFGPLADAAFKLQEIGIEGPKVVSILSGITAQAVALGRGSQDVGRVVGMLEMMTDSGKAAGRGLMQLERQGYQVMGTLSKMTGISNKELSKMFTTGKIDAKAAIDLLTQGWDMQFGEVAKKVSHTFADEQVRTWQQLDPMLATAIHPILGLAEHTMKDLQALISQVGPSFAEGISGGLSLAASALTRGLDYLIELTGIKLEAKSPSQVFIRYGLSIMQGLSDGIIQGQDKTQRALEASFQKIISNSKLMDLIRKAAEKYGVPADLIAAVIAKESSGNISAVSPKGARGLMQLMPATAYQWGVKNVFDPEQNIMGGTAYLKSLFNIYGDQSLALAAYNAGEFNVNKYGRQVPPFAETQDYVKRINALVGGYRQTYGAETAMGFGPGYTPTSSYSFMTPSTLNQIAAGTQAQLATPWAQGWRTAPATGRAAGYGAAISGGGYGRGAFMGMEAAPQRALFAEAQEVIPVKVVSSDAPIGTAIATTSSLAKRAYGAMTGVLDEKGLSSMEKETMDTAEELGKLVTSGKALVNEEQLRANALKISRTESIFGEARRSIAEGTNTFGIQQSEISALVGIPKSISAAATDFITKWDLSGKTLRTMLVSDLRSIVLEPVGKIFGAIVDRWVSQMLVSLLGEKAAKTAEVTAQELNTAATIANTAALTAATAGKAASSFLDALSAATEVTGAIGVQSGGYISGPGGPKDDAIPMNLSNGEYVMNAGAVGHYGRGFFDMLNGGRMPRSTHNYYNITLNAPVVGGSSHSAPLARRQYLEMLAPAMKEATR